MKRIMESWNRFLNEAETDIKVYCDMDGVLVDFSKGVLTKLNNVISYLADNQDNIKVLKFNPKVPKNVRMKYILADFAVQDLGGDYDIKITEEHISRDRSKANRKVLTLMYHLIERDPDAQKFWEGLEWFAGGGRLWGAIKNTNIEILTSPVGSLANLDEEGYMTSDETNGSIIGKANWVRKHLGADVKVKYAQNKGIHGDPNAILIDDTKKQTNWFSEAGGKVILHENADDTIKELEGMGIISKNEY